MKQFIHTPRKYARARVCYRYVVSVCTIVYQEDYVRVIVHRYLLSAMPGCNKVPVQEVMA